MWSAHFYIHRLESAACLSNNSIPGIGDRRKLNDANVAACMQTERDIRFLLSSFSLAVLVIATLFISAPAVEVICARFISNLLMTPYDVVSVVQRNRRTSREIDIQYVVVAGC